MRASASPALMEAPSGRRRGGVERGRADAGAGRPEALNLCCAHPTTAVEVSVHYATDSRLGTQGLLGTATPIFHEPVLDNHRASVKFAYSTGKSLTSAPNQKVLTRPSRNKQTRCAVVADGAVAADAVVPMGARCHSPW